MWELKTKDAGYKFKINQNKINCRTSDPYLFHSEENNPASEHMKKA